MIYDDFENGEVILIDKPLNWTSFDVVKKIRGLIQKTYGIKKLKVGHAGTLDPLATGLMILCTGKKTKDLNKFQDLPKTYAGTFVIGATTPSYDRETEINQTFSIKSITIEQIRNAAKSMIGEQMQVPPLFSAKKIDGERAYELARKGIDKELEAKEICIYQFEITGIELPEISFEIKCSKGTYIRSIANDIGKILGCGAYLDNLRRTAIGNNTVEQAYSIEKYCEELQENLIENISL